MPAIATRCIACEGTQLERQPAVLMPFVAQRALLWEPCEIKPDWGLRSVPAGHALPLCMSLHCPHCGMLFLDMRLDDAEMARLYADYRGPDYTAQRERWEPGYAARNAALEAGDAHLPRVEALLAPLLPPQPAILDWGGAAGHNTPLKSRAALHHVLDISGRPLVHGARSVSADAARSQHYDLVVLSNVLEHVADPLALLQAAAEHVQGPGLLYLEVPFETTMRAAETDATAWRGKRHWHEHINFFSRESLRRLVTRAGLVARHETVISLEGGGAQLGWVCRRLNTARQK
jgi:SAM-dependent methyltransferase